MASSIAGGPAGRTLLSSAARWGGARAGGRRIVAPPSRPRARVVDVGPAFRRARHRAYATSSPSLASTAQLVKRLREATGAPMMECKKALSSPEVDGDVEKAREWLRKHGSAKASSKVAGRDALEGLVGMTIAEGGEALWGGKGGQVGSLVKVASETDFASRSDVFSAFVEDVALAAAMTTTGGEIGDIPFFLEISEDGKGKTLDERLNDAILAIRENLRVESMSVLAASPSSVLGGYVHGKTSPGSSCGSAAALVELGKIGGGAIENLEEARDAAKKLAMHVVAAKPLYLDEAGVPPAVVEKEMEILREKLGDTNKPPEIVDKILKGRMRKFYEGCCLTEQPHMVEEGGPRVKKALGELGLEARAFRLAGTGGR